MQAPHLRRTIRLYVLAAAIAATVALCVAAWDYSWGIVSPKLLNAVLTILLVGLVAELGAVSLNIGSASFSVAFIPYLAATYLFPTIWAMLVAAVAECAVETFVRKKPLIKIVFNTSKEVLALGLASSVYQLLGGIPTIEPTQFRILPGAILGASLTFGLIDSLGVGYAVALSERLNFTQVWSRMYGGHVLYDLFAAPIPAFLAYLYVRYELLGLISLVLPLFVVRHIYKMNLQLEQANRDLLELMVKNIEARDPYTSGHSQRVAQYARVIAKEAAVSFWHVEQIVTGALLHDLGKTYSEYAPLLQKEGRLTSEEKELLQSHPVRSAELVHTISSLRGAVENAVRHHHENYDGSGYPDGLAGEEIPLGARIIMIADTLDAMTTDRPYRTALSLERAIEELRRHAGKQFDPRLVEIVNRSAAIRRLTATASRVATEPVLGTPNRSPAQATRPQRAVV